MGSRSSTSRASSASIRRRCESTTGDQLDNGQVKARRAESLFRKATTEGPQSVTAAIFWLKTKGGWRETSQDHRVGLYDLSKITGEELDRRIEAAQASIAASEHHVPR